jgi:hypothetical protein
MAQAGIFGEGLGANGDSGGWAFNQSGEALGMAVGFDGRNDTGFLRFDQFQSWRISIMGPPEPPTPVPSASPATLALMVSLLGVAAFRLLRSVRTV